MKRHLYFLKDLYRTILNSKLSGLSYTKRRREADEHVYQLYFAGKAWEVAVL